MPVLSKRGLRKLHKVLEDWISEDWGDSSDSDDFFQPISRRSSHTMRTMDHKRSDAASSYTSEQPGTSSEDERMSSRMSQSSSSTDHLPPPPKYESLVQHPVRDYSDKETRWDREIDEIVGDLGRSTSLSGRDGYSTLPTAKRVSSGAHSFVQESSTSSSRRSLSPPRSAAALDRDFDWDRSLLSNDDFFRDSRLSQRNRPFGGRPFGGMRSHFGEDIDRFFGRGTFSTDWDTFFPEITFSEFGRGSSMSTRNQTKVRDVMVARPEQDFKIEVDVQGFEPHELLVKTAGQSLLVLARSELSNEGHDRNHEFRELRKEFTIPSNVNPTDITSNLTPEGVLVIEAPTADKLPITSQKTGNRNEIQNTE